MVVHLAHGLLAHSSPPIMPSPTSPTVDQTESVTFAYGALAHGFLFVVAVALFLASNTLTHVLPFAYVCAHCTLSVTMGLRSLRKWRSSLLVTVLGVCAHTTLFVYGCCASSFAWMPTLFILAQVLMAMHYVYNYLHTHDASGRMQQSHPVVFNTPRRRQLFAAAGLCHPDLVLLSQRPVWNTRRVEQVQRLPVRSADGRRDVRGVHTAHARVALVAAATNQARGMIRRWCF